MLNYDPGIRRKYPSEYKAWQNMRKRCYGNYRNPKRYSGRGITVCDAWLESFENFMSDMGAKPSKDHSLDRIDNDGNYTPENCRWATHIEQQRNRTNNIYVELMGIKLRLLEWIELSGVNYHTVIWRFRSGWDPLKAILLPANCKWEIEN